MPTYTSQYPPAHNSTYVKATSVYENDYAHFAPYFATDPSRSLVGDQHVSVMWASANYSIINQRFHIDLGSAKIIKRIYYENAHHYGIHLEGGVKTFTVWGSNNATAFATLTYATDTNWTEITPSQATFDKHIAANQGDAKYITLTNSTAYRYYAIKIADNWGGDYYMSLRRIVLQTEDTPVVSVPTVTTGAATGIGGTTATVPGNITATGGVNATVRGVCYNTTGTPTTADSTAYATGSFGTGAYNTALSSLAPGTHYYARAYAINSAGVGYGSEVEFDTLNIPTVTTTAISGITGTDADSGGNVTAEGGAAVTARGVCWNTTGTPTTASSKTTDSSGSGVFVSDITPLSAGVTYYVRAYATNSVGTAYGAQVSFQTLTVPTLSTTNPATSITKAKALISCNIVSTGGVSPTIRGICWNTTGSPTTANSKSEDSGTFYAGSFSKYATGLSPRTTYYVRAYATNSVGTGYGNVITFTTLSKAETIAPQLTLKDTYYPRRSSVYDTPLNTNDMLPLVYGNLTDGVNGNWQLPCIDTLADGGVYCYAAHEVLSVANGNSITVYKEGVLVSSADYTFDESNDYEGNGVIATITFDAGKSPGNDEISVRGKGKPTASGGAVLMTNIIDILYDFLTVENDFSIEDFDATYKATAAYTFLVQGYLAAGVIEKDDPIWDILQKMMASFLGSVYLSGEGKIVLEIDDGTLPAESFKGILNQSDVEFISGTQKLSNLINQCPALYCYDYVVDQFKYITDSIDHADIASQNIYGVRKPESAYEFDWCRDVTSVQKIQDILVGKFKYPLWEIEVDDITMKRLDCDVLKVVSYSAKNIFDEFGNPLINQLWKVLTFNPDFVGAKIKFGLLQTGFYMTIAYLADGGLNNDDIYEYVEYDDQAIRISSVDGKAFIDNLPSAITDSVAENIYYHLIEIYDASGRMLRGYLSAAGTWEDLGAAGDGEDESVYIPQFTTDDVAGVTFGGFYVDKFIASQPSARNEAGNAWYDVAHGGNAGSVVPKSRRGVPVWDYIKFPQAMIACANKGKGWHLISAFEWASLAFLSKKLDTQPHGGNANTDPPSDKTYTTETAQLDKHLKAEVASYNRPLPGTGPITWAHNHLASGVYDLQGLVNQWVLMMMSTDGYPYVPANLDTTYTGSPYGRGTISGSGGASPTLTVDGAGVNWLKDWTVDEFNTNCFVYIAEAASGAGALFAVTDTTATTVVLTNGDAPGDGTATFAIFKLVATDITSGMTSGHKILTLRDADADLNAFALPATADVTGADAYGKDGFSFDKAAARAALRGGYVAAAEVAGVFWLGLVNAPSESGSRVGFRAAKAKGAP
jgi:hypothetical protein